MHIWKKSGITLKMRVSVSGHVVNLEAKLQLHENCNRFPLSKYLQIAKGKCEKVALDESEYFLMCRERHRKVNGAPEVEERGH